MKSKELKKIRTQSVDQLIKDLTTKKRELLVENVNVSVGKSSNPNKKRELKRDISQISTIIREKELQEKVDQSAKNKEQSENKKKGTKTKNK